LLAIGSHQLANNLLLAPMAGVTDLPFRRLCMQMGAGAVVGEMISSDPTLRNTRKSSLRRRHDGEPGLRIVQIAGAEPEMMAEAARFNVAEGAQVIDINMGCPAKKVCRKAAGSALLRDPELVRSILRAVVAAVDVPVTLKFRTGWDAQNRNALDIARIAEDAGIQMLSLHGRTRACKYNGEAEYDTIAAVKQAVSIPVIANGDIDSPEKAKYVLDYTQADGLMIGRAAQGRPWLFREIGYFLETGKKMPNISLAEVEQILTGHIIALHQFYGEFMGVRIARKHTAWYLAAAMTDSAAQRAFKARFNQFETAAEQLAGLAEFFNQQKLEKAQAA